MIRLVVWPASFATRYMCIYIYVMHQDMDDIIQAWLNSLQSGKTLLLTSGSLLHTSRQARIFFVIIAVVLLNLRLLVTGNGSQVPGG